MIREHLRGRLEGWLLRVWFGNASATDRLLALMLAPIALPLSALVARVARGRAGRVRRQSAADPVPVIVTGNLIAGGTGKTPLVAAIASGLAERGWRPGLLARGYRGGAGVSGSSADGPALVGVDGDPDRFGDEAVQLAGQTRLPLAVGADRAAALALLLEGAPDRDVVISDDGLQHVGLPRRLELIVVDDRGIGNGRCLPAGPLREPAERIRSVDAVILVGAAARPPTGAKRVFRSHVEALGLRSLDGRMQWQPADFARQYRDQALTALAGIARPERFFRMLQDLGLAPDCHPLPDHARIDPDWLATLPGRWVLMTAKDAVKCRALPPTQLARCVCLDIAAVPEIALLEWIEKELANPPVAFGSAALGHRPRA